MRIVSLVPAVTEILTYLQLTDAIVGVTHACHLTNKPQMVTWEQGQFVLQEAALVAAAPDLIFVQSTCANCMVDERQLRKLVADWPRQPIIINQSPSQMQEVLLSLLQVGEATQQLALAETLFESLQLRIDAIQQVLYQEQLPESKWLMIEWWQPLMAAGHWIPEMVELAGGFDGLGKPGQKSARMGILDVVNFNPDGILIAQCGETAATTFAAIQRAPANEAWQSITAIQQGKVFAVNGSLFTQPSPFSLVKGLEVLAALFHPDHFAMPLNIDLIPISANALFQST